MAKSLSAARNAVNRKLCEIGRTYHEAIPTEQINEVLVENGFDRLEDGIYTGNGESVEPVGLKTWLRMQWYRMTSGRYEITAYVS